MNADVAAKAAALVNTLYAEPDNPNDPYLVDGAFQTAKTKSIQGLYAQIQALTLLTRDEFLAGTQRPTPTGLASNATIELSEDEIVHDWFYSAFDKSGRHIDQAMTRIKNMRLTAPATHEQLLRVFHEVTEDLGPHGDVGDSPGASG